MFAFSRARTLVAAVVVAVLVLCVGISPALANGDAPEGLAGLVKTEQSPLAAARVYAYQVADLSLTRATTDTDGKFLFRSLPAGVYKIIAHKTGFIPAIVLVTRAAQSASDFLEFQLVSEAQLALQDGDDFWSVRRKIPGDVLRSIELAEATDVEVPIDGIANLSLETRIASVDAGEIGSLRRSDSRLGLSAPIGHSRLTLEGRFEDLGQGSGFASAAPAVQGKTTSLTASLETSNGARIDFASTQHSFSLGQHTAGTPASFDSPVTFESYRAGWSKQLDDRSRAELSLVLLEQENFHTQGLLAPSSIPTSSASMRLGGTYSRAVGASFGFRGGLHYEQLTQRMTGTALPDARLAGAVVPGYVQLARERIDAYGVATTRLSPGILVEYGLYSTMRDGGFSMSPHGSLLVNVGSKWQADAVVREQIVRGAEQGFSLAYYRGGETSQNVDRHYYRLGFKRKISAAESFRIGAVHREISDTLRMFFNDDFFNQVESLYLVRGDQLPELEIALSRKLGRRIFTTLQTQYGAGGGGGVVTEGNNGPQSSFENRVRYLVTSLDTQFQRTATGLFLAFHRIEQSLDPLSGNLLAPEAGLDRLQMRVTQELGFLVDLGSEWAVLLNVELSRGQSPFTSDSDDGEIRSEIAGGIAVKF